MKVGDYVRTKYGIAKYIKDLVTKQTIYFVIDKPIVYDNVEGSENLLCSNEIIKSSPNIIDLIEVGDYVNGHRVLRTNDYEVSVESDDVASEIWEKISACEIKSIVTREMFESMEYKVGE